MGVCMDNFIDCILVYYNEDAILQVTPSFFGASLLGILPLERYELEGNVELIMSPEVYLERYSGQVAANVPVYAFDCVHVVPEILHVHRQQQTMFVAEMSRHTAYAVWAKSDGTLKGIILSPQPLAVKEGARKPSS